MDIYLPKQIKEYTDGYTCVTDSTGMSASDVYIFEDMVLKIEKHSPDTDKTVQVMEWLQGKLPVPKIICYCIENGKSYTLMSKIKGNMTCDEQLMKQQDKTVYLLAQGLKMLWQQDTAGCPRTITVEDDIAQARYNFESGLIDTEAVDFNLLKKHNITDLNGLVRWLENHRPNCDPVLSHGDYCMPNILVDDNGIAGFIDLGETAVADRYRDISMCFISLKNNYSGVFGGKVYPDFNPYILFEKLGFDADRDKLDFYLLLNELYKLK